jgi:hypothetical protein
MRWLVCVVALAACGDDGAGNGGDGGMRDAPAPPNTGSVFLSSYKSMQTGTQVMGNIINASFLPAQPQAFTCTSQVVGPCVLSQCTQSTALPMYVSGGTITVGGLSKPVTMTPSTITNMYQPDNSANPFAGGETVTISGAGATAPAFMLSLTAPGLASITTPAKPAGTNPLVINRSQDFAVAWTGGGPGDMDFVFGSTNGSSPGPSLNCSFAASTGSGTIPAAALAMLPAGNGTFSGSTNSLKSVDVGEWRFWGQAYFTAVWSVDMSQFGVTTTLQ